ncbi:3426_t:CDS:2, partial [Cetraspora pellucida]
MPPPNKRKLHLEAARKSKAEHAHLKKNKTMHQSNDLLDYELVDEELDDHIWVDEGIDEKADSYFEVLLAAARNNNSWKVASRPTYNYGDSGRTLRRKKAELKKAAQNTKSITSYLSLTNSLRFNIASTSIHKFLAADAVVQLMETNLVDEAVDTIVIDEDGDTIMVDNAVDSIVESVEINVNDDKAYNMLEKDSKQIDKGTKVRLQAALQYLRLRYQGWTKINSSATIAGSLGWGAYKTRCIEKKTTISERTALEWLKKLGWSYKEWKKDVYVDEHEREDIVRYQQEVFLLMMAELEPLLIEYDENDLTLVKKNIPLNQKLHCIITHDETTLATNDDKKTGWGPGGRCIHVSEFLCEPLGRVHLTVEQHLAHSEIPNRYITETLEVGVNHDGYWNNISETSKNISGRPPSDLWDKHIKKGKKVSKGHYERTCNYCSYFKHKGSLQEFEKHLANNCPNVPNFLKTLRLGYIPPSYEILSECLFSQEVAA